MSVNPLTRVTRRRARLDEARAILDSEVVAAHDAGYSLRKIAEAAGLSHEQVRRTIANARANRQ